MPQVLLCSACVANEAHKDGGSLLKRLRCGLLDLLMQIWFLPAPLTHVCVAAGIKLALQRGRLESVGTLAVSKRVYRHFKSSVSG